MKRVFTSAQKLAFLKQADECPPRGVAAFLRRERLTSTLLFFWKQARESGELQEAPSTFTPSKVMPDFEIFARFERQYIPEPTTGCWLWLGSPMNVGYGKIRIAGKMLLAHRVAYEHFKGPILEGLTIDHVQARGCASKLCVNPDHLEVVTNRENILRGNNRAAQAAQQTHCVHGHLLMESSRDKRGKRKCQACARRWWREHGSGARRRRKLAQGGARP